MWPLETLADFDIFQIDDKTVFKKNAKQKKQNQKAKKITPSVSVYKLQLWGKPPQTCLVAPFVDIPVLVSEGKWTWNKFVTLFVSEGEFPWEYYFSRSLLQIIDVFYLFNDGCCEAHRRAIASYTAASESCTLTHQLLLMKHLEKDLQNQAISLIISCAFFHSVIFFLTSLIFGEIN